MIKIAFLGAGGIAQAHARALAEIPDAELTGVFDINPERAEATASKYGAEAHAAVEDCIAASDAVYILTPPSTHRKLALAAIRARKHVLCEKPIAIAVDDAEAIVEAAQQAGVWLMTAFNHRFRKGFIRLKEIVESGVLGDVVTFWCQRIGMGISAAHYNWRTDPELMCGMSIESLSHDIDLIRWIAGEITDVRAILAASRPEIPGFDDHAHAIFSLVGGGAATLHATWSSQIGTNSRGVVGTKGAAILRGPGQWDLNTFHWKTANMEHQMVEVINDGFDGHSYLEENRHFIASISAGVRPSITGEDGLAALRVSHAMHASHRKGAVVALPSG